MRRLLSSVAVLVVLSSVPVHAGGSAEEFGLGTERVLMTGSGSYQVSGGPGAFVVVTMEPVRETNVLRMSRFLGERRTSTEPIAEGIDADAPVFLDSTRDRWVAGWRAGGIWSITAAGDDGTRSTLALEPGTRLLGLAAKGDGSRRVLAVLQPQGVVELDPGSGARKSLRALAGSPLAVALASDRDGAAVAYLERETGDLLFLSLDAGGRVTGTRKLNTAPASGISNAIGLRDGRVVIGWIERWADEDVAVVGRLPRTGNAAVLETVPLSTIGTRVTRVELASSGDRMAVWDENGEHGTVKVVALDESREIQCAAVLHDAATHRREWLIGGRDGARLFAERVLGDGGRLLTVRDLRCAGSHPDEFDSRSGVQAHPAGTPEQFGRGPASPASSILGDVSDPCDGIDNDDDGTVDEGCDRVCDDPAGRGWESNVSTDDEESWDPAMVWNGTRFGVVWRDNRHGPWEIYFALLDASGNRIGSATRVTNNSSNKRNPSVAWNGSEFGVTWEDNRNGQMEIYFARLSASGAKIGGDVAVTSDDAHDSMTPRIVADGTGYAIAWRDDRHVDAEIYFARITSTGTKVGSDVRVTSSGADSVLPSLVGNSSGFGIAWSDYRNPGNTEIYFARLDAAGTKIGSDVRVTDHPGGSGGASLAWNGTGYGVAWDDDRDGNHEIYFARLSSTGTKIGTDTRVTSDPADSASPSLVWTGSEYGVAWSDLRDDPYDMLYQIYFSRVGTDGIEIGDDVRVENDVLESYSPNMVWTGTGYGVVWTDAREAVWYDVFFTLVRCCDDEDADGYTECEERDDGDPESYPGVDEACDGRDNDEDGIVDDGCDGVCDSPQVAGPDSRITDDAGISGDPSLAWAGNRHGVAWQDDRDGNVEIYFARANGAGAKIGADLRVTNAAGDSEAASLVWTGTEYGLAWHDARDGNTEIYFARIDADGNKIGSDVRITDDGSISEYPSLVWAGNGYGIAWEDRRDGNREIYFARVDTAGNLLGTATRVTVHGYESYRPALAWNGTEYGVAWYDYRDGNYEIYFTRLDGNGIEIGDDRRITDDTGSSYSPSLAWNDSGWAVAWSDDRYGNTEIFAAILDGTGTKIGIDRRITMDAASSASPSLTWTGAEYAVAWQDNRDATYEIFLARLDSAGSKTGSEIQLTSFGSSRYHPSLVWTGEGYSAAWYDNRHGSPEIYLGRVACCDDADGDGISECAGDPNDANPEAHPGATETCDGEDENGTEGVDEDCDTECDAPSTSEPEITIAESPARPRFIDVAWTGGGYGVTWQDSRRVPNDEIYFQLLNPAGAAEGPELRLSNVEQLSTHPSIVWTGTEFGVAWQDFLESPSRILFARIDADGNKIGTERTIVHGSSITSAPDLVWAGTHYGVVWHDDRTGIQEVYFCRLDREGNRVGSEIRISGGTGESKAPRLTWDGTGYGVVWHDERALNWDIYFARLDELGNRIGNEVRVTDDPADSYYPAVVWTGSEYGVAWEDRRHGSFEIYFARMDVSGSMIGGEVRVTDDPGSAVLPQIQWTGSEYGILWRDDRSGEGDIGVYFARVGSDGVKRSSDLRVPDGPAEANSAVPVWTGDAFAVVWADDAGTGSSAYWTRIACCDDYDNDGYTECSGDSNDNDPATHAGGIESCDSADNDGDGQSDENCDSACDAPEEAGSDVRVSNATGASSVPSMVWAAGNFAVAWEDSRAGNNDLYFARLNPSGATIGAETQLTADLGNSEDPALAWTGSGYGVAWKDDRDGNAEIYIAFLDRHGIKTSSDGRVTRDGGASQVPDLVWNGSEFAVVWEDDRDGNWEIYFARVDRNGIKIGADMRITRDGGSSLKPRIVWTGDEYGVAWRDNRDGNWEIYLARLDPLGAVLGSPTRVTDDAGYSSAVSLAWTGTEYGLAWNDTRDTEWEVWFARVDSTGAKIGSDVRVTDDDVYSSWYPSLVWTGDEYAVSWRDDRDGNDEIYLARLNGAGAKIGSDMRLTVDGNASLAPGLVWNGEMYAVAWQDFRDGNYEIYYTGIRCCDDLDGDGYSECDERDDGDDQSFPGMDDLCDGKDNDGDDVVDGPCDGVCDAPERVGSDYRVTAAAGGSWMPRMAWSGSEYGVAFWSQRDGQEEIYFARIDRSGAQIGGDVRVTDESHDSEQPSIVWNGDGYGIVWTDSRDGGWQIYFARLDAEGNKIAGDVPVTSGATYADAPSLAWTGTGYGVAWWEDPGSGAEIHFARLDPDGNRIGSIARVSDSTGDARNPSVAWNGVEFGVAWEDNRDGNLEVYFTLLDRFGVEIGDDRRITDAAGSSDGPSLVSNGTGWAVAWRDLRDGNAEIYFALIDAAGNKSGTDERVSTDAADSFRASLVWTGSEYAVAWQDDRDGTDEIFLARIDAAGAAAGPELQLTSQASDRHGPSLVWTGDGLAVAWQDSRHADPEVYFGRVACCDDFDGDGYTECAGDDNDSDPAVYPGAQEACDGRDDDGDDVVDEVCDSACDAPQESGGDVRVTSDSALSAEPSTAWNGAGYGVAWQDSREGNSEIYFAVLDPSGGHVTADLPVTGDPGVSEDADLVWTGDGYGVVWKDDRDGNEEIYFARLDESGAKIGGDMRITRDAGASHLPDLAWNGSGFAVVWEDDRNGDWDIYFARIDAAGNKIGSDVRVMGGTSSSLQPELVWTGTEYGMTWRDDRDGNWEVYFNRFDEHGKPLRADSRITVDAGYSSAISLVWTGSEYAVAWNDTRDTAWEVWFTRIDHLGNEIGDDVRVTADDAYNSWYPSLTWTGAEYGLAWRDDRDGNDEIYFTRLSGTGATLMADARLTSDGSASHVPQALWSGDRYAITWQDYRDGNAEIYFTAVDCCDDADGDGYGECAGDTDDRDAGVHPDRIEHCDDRDNDSDGQLDEVCDGTCDNPAKASQEVDVSGVAASSPVSNDLVWNGSGYGAAWIDDRDGHGEIYFARLDASGDKLGSEVRVTTSGLPASPGLAMVWSGSEYGVVWRGGDDIYFARLDVSGAMIGSETRLSYNPNGLFSMNPDVVWTGSEWGTVWEQHGGGGGGRIHFARLDAAGNRIGDEIRIVEGDFNPSHPSLAWNGSGYGVAWQSNQFQHNEIYLTRLDAAGARIAPDVGITVDDDITSQYAVLRWVANGYAVAWEDARDSSDEVYFLLLEADGTWNGSEIRVTPDDGFPSESPDMAWTGSGYGIAWKDDRSGDSEIYFATLDSLGGSAGSELRVTDDPEIQIGAAVAWSGDGFALAWIDHRDPGSHVFASVVRCCDDADADGYTECGGDRNDADPDAYPGHRENCDGGDDDADGSIDEVCDRSCDAPEQAGANQRISETPAASRGPEAVWAGDRFGLVWDDERDGNREIYYAAVDRWGNRIGTDRRFTSNSAVSADPALAWNGNEYGLVWRDSRDGNYEIYFGRANADGQNLGGGRRLTHDTAQSYGPVVVWSGGEYGVAWQDDRDGAWAIWFCRVDASGNKIGPDIRVSNTGGNSWNPTVAWTGEEYGVAWREERDGNWEIYFARLDRYGLRIGDEMRITDDPANSRGPDLLWTGTQYALAWYDDRDGDNEIFFTRLWEDGSRAVGDISVTHNGGSSAMPRLAWTGQEYGLTWYDNSYGSFEIVFARMSYMGAFIGPEIVITDDSYLSEYPVVAWSGEGFLTVWQDNSTGELEVYGAAIRCCEDGDDDGYTVCDGDGNDADPAIHPGADEICDGADNNSDGAVDEVCDGTCDTASEWGVDHQLTTDPGESYGNALAWNGSEYGIVWKDTRDGNSEVYFARLDQDGDRIGDEIRITDDPATSNQQVLAWNGSEYGLVWRDTRDGIDEVYFARVGADGGRIGSDVRLTESAGSVTGTNVIWAGDRYAVGWSDSRDGNWEVYLALFDEEGNRIGQENRITEWANDSWGVKLAWSGTEYGMVWRDNMPNKWAIYFARADASGQRIGEPVAVTLATYDSYHPDIVWNGVEYGVVWQDKRNSGNNEIYFARLGADGTKIGSDVRITNNGGSSASPRIAWSGTEYGVTWYDNYQGNFETYFIRLDSTGTPVGSEVRLSNASGLSEWPNLVWTGQHFGVAWSDDRGAAYEVFFATVKCCGNDQDADTWGACDDCDDLDAAANPGETEVCDFIDNNCDGAIDEGFPVPGSVAGLQTGADKQTLTWSVEGGADRYDVTKGDLAVLRGSGGDYTSAVTACLEDDGTDTSAGDPEMPASPGDGFFYLVRAQYECKDGSYDTAESGQVAGRDEEIRLAAAACP